MFRVHKLADNPETTNNTNIGSTRKYHRLRDIGNNLVRFRARFFRFRSILVHSILPPFSKKKFIKSISRTMRHTLTRKQVAQRYLLL